MHFFTKRKRAKLKSAVAKLKSVGAAPTKKLRRELLPGHEPNSEREDADGDDDDYYEHADGETGDTDEDEEYVEDADDGDDDDYYEHADGDTGDTDEDEEYVEDADDGDDDDYYEHADGDTDEDEENVVVVDAEDDEVDVPAASSPLLLHHVASSSSSISAINPAITPELVNELMVPFLASNWNKHWTGKVGGSKSPAECDALLRIVVKFIYRCYCAAQQDGPGQAPPETGLDMLTFLLRIISSRTQRLTLQCVCDGWTLAAGTLKSYLYSLLDATRWLEKQPVALAYRRFGPGLLEFQNMIHSNLNGLKKTLAREELAKDKTVETMIYQRRLPVGGLAELQNVLLKDLEYYQSIQSCPAVDPISYAWMLQTLSASFYVTAPNGRQGGIQTLQLSHLQDLEEMGVACSSKFKTQSSHHFQPVLLSPQCKVFLMAYLRYFRPSVLPSHHTPDRDDALFLNFDGRPTRAIGRLVTAYYRRKLGITLTTTTIRSMLETAAAGALREGVITTGMRNAVAAVNGHSLSMANSTYVRNNKRDDAAFAMKAFNLLKENTLPVAGLVVGATGDDGNALPLRAFPLQEQWGLSHPDYGSCGKARWTEAEKDYVSETANALLEENAAMYRPRLMAGVLARIRADKSVHALFHVRHTLDAGRLRCAWRKRSPPAVLSSADGLEN